MQPTQTLPQHYELAWNLDLKHNQRLNIILQVIGLGWMVIAGWLLTGCVLWLRPDYKETLGRGVSGNLLSMLLWLLVAMAITIALHELTHGLFFWLFSGHKPEFGIGPGYAFAAMPDWYYPKHKYLVIALAPLLLLSALGLFASLFVPQTWLGWLLAAMIINAGGAIGDMYVSWRIARETDRVWVKDTGDGFQLYRRLIE